MRTHRDHISDSERQKLAGIEVGTEVNLAEGWKPSDVVFIFLVLPFLIGLIAFLVMRHEVDIKTLQTQTITIHSTEVRKLLSDCNGVFKIHQEWLDGQLTYTVSCDE